MRPSPPRQRTNASGPRHRTVTRSITAPSSDTGAPSLANTNTQGGLRRSCRIDRTPCSNAASASGQAAARGISETSTANGASSASAARTASGHHDGRHSILPPEASVGRQLADIADERVEFVICGTLMAEEPGPQPIVLAIQQP